MKNIKKLIVIFFIIIIVILVIVIFLKQNKVTSLIQTERVSHMINNEPDYNFYRDHDQSFGCSFYSKDNIVYHITEGVDNFPPHICEIAQVDKRTFKALDLYYEKDINAVYALCNKIDKADPATFEVIYSGDSQGCTLFSNTSTTFAIDKNYVFHQGSIDSMFDRTSFEYLGSGYIKTKDGIFFNDKKIIGADIETFEFLTLKNCDAGSLCDYNAQDKNHQYKYGEVVK